jgi:two-component system sensor histidine kinase DesK
VVAAPTSPDAAGRPNGPGQHEVPARPSDPIAPTAPTRPDDLARVRTFTRWSLVFVGAITVLLPLANLAGRNDAPAVQAAIVLVLLLVGAEQLRLLLGAMGDVEPRALLRPRVAVAGVAALGLFALGAADADSSGVGWWALPYAGLLGAAVLWLPSARRQWLVGGGAALAALVGVVAALLGDGVVAVAALVPVVVIVSVVGGDVLQLWLWNVTLRLDEARATAGEVAVLRERLRFSADLHDVQGHHLQAISLKAELTRRLVGKDDDAARGYAADVQELTLCALAETRALVHGYRRVGLVTELENAVHILRAAGVKTSITGAPEQVPETLQPLFGALVREGTTNLLRHARAECCTLSVGIEGPDVVLRVQDDGTARPSATQSDDAGTGVLALRERFAAVGGRVDAGPLPGRGFVLAGRAPR